MKKRIILIVFIVVVIFLSAIGYSRFIEPNLLKGKTLVIETQKPIKPCTMVYFTDTHFGKYYDVNHARKIVEKINKAKPDIVVFGGDLLNVIVAHEPIVSQFIESKSENFLLSGHTHGGQVNIPFITSRFLPEGSGQFTKGFYTEKDIGTAVSLKMYTSSGIGMTRYPFRFLNIPEIIQIN